MKNLFLLLDYIVFLKDLIQRINVLKLPINKRSDGCVHRISKGMSPVILDLCTRDKTDATNKDN